MQNTDEIITREINNITTNFAFFTPISIGSVLQPQALSPSISDISRLNSLGIIIRNGNNA